VASATAGAGGPSPALVAVLVAALLALLPALRALPRARASACSLSLVLLVERPG
jgi:hypothetical protein